MHAHADAVVRGTAQRAGSPIRLRSPLSAVAIRPGRQHPCGRNTIAQRTRKFPRTEGKSYEAKMKQMIYDMLTGNLPDLLREEGPRHA
jgi:hypothetical protein